MKISNVDALWGFFFYSYANYKIRYWDSLQRLPISPPRHFIRLVLFIVMINDLHFSCTNFKYVDDTNVLHISDDPQSDMLQSAATHASNWSK